jgi:hypothetical protein
MPSYASFNVSLLLCMIMAVIALLVGRSQSFASPHFVLSMSSTRISDKCIGCVGDTRDFLIVIAGLFERDSFDLFLPEFDKPLVIYLRETCCCSTNLCTWRPNTVYKNRRVRRHQPPPGGARRRNQSGRRLVEHDEGTDLAGAYGARRGRKA